MDFPSVLVSVSEQFFFPDVKVFFFTVHKYSVGFSPSLVHKIDANPLLDSCCVIQAFPGERTLLFSTQHQNQPNQELGLG